MENFKLLDCRGEAGLSQGSMKVDMLESIKRIILGQ
jgi:hypothetical protein